LGRVPVLRLRGQRLRLDVAVALHALGEFMPGGTGVTVVPRQRPFVLGPEASFEPRASLAAALHHHGRDDRGHDDDRRHDSDNRSCGHVVPPVCPGVTGPVGRLAANGRRKPV
jgi:hypothetical protein